MESRDDLTTAEYAALAEFRFLIRRFLHFSEQEARSRGIEPQQYQALLAIRGLAEGTRPKVGELAARLMIRHHSAVELLDRMVRRGVVARVHADTDQREVFIHLTTAGRRLLRELAIVHRTELERAVPELVRALHRVAPRRKAAGSAA